MGPPVFVIGAPRSGTTWLWRHLNAHPDLHLTFEVGYFDLVARYRGRPGRFAETLRRNLGTAWQRLPESVLQEAVPDGTSPADARVLESLCLAASQRAGKPRWGDKTPAHTAHLESLFAAFPEARVVHIVRDPVAVCRSLTAVPWGQSAPVWSALGLRYQLGRVVPFRERIHEVRLEDVLADPERHLRSILEHCALRWDPAVLEPETACVDTPPLPWLETRPDRRAALPRPLPLEPVEAARLARVLAPERGRYGYPAVPDVRRKGLRAHVGRAAADLDALGRYLRAAWALQRTTRAWPPVHPVRVFEAACRLNPGAVMAVDDALVAVVKEWMDAEA